MTPEAIDWGLFLAIFTGSLPVGFIFVLGILSLPGPHGR